MPSKCPDKKTLTKLKAAMLGHMQSVEETKAELLQIAEDCKSHAQRLETLQEKIYRDSEASELLASILLGIYGNASEAENERGAEWFAGDGVDCRTGLVKLVKH